MTKNKKENAKAFKHWIGPDVIQKYADGLAGQLPAFNRQEFLRIKEKLPALELKERVDLIARELTHHIPDDFPRALEILMQVTHSQKLKGFELWPITHFIGVKGLRHADQALKAMQEVTVLFTAEFCIRPFINQDYAAILPRLVEFASDPNVHVRRWASEGSRPRLPWGEKLNAVILEPSLTLPILERLKFDPELYVQKSVANHLNDIAKDHPMVVLKTLRRWKKMVPKGFEKHFQFILQKALRTLIKQGHPEALSLMGIKLQPEKIKLKSMGISPLKVKLGDALSLEATIENKSAGTVNFMLDYIIYYRKKNGQLAPKVYKGKKGRLNPGEKLIIHKKHSFKPITTRTYYTGGQAFAWQLNGLIQKQLPFYLG